ncbi:MAG: hypothetical protein ACXAEU_22530 [Candidatus Hodarchaeales archaeon]|jgi:DNA-binding MarR family transcriptional regulator
MKQKKITMNTSNLIVVLLILFSLPAILFLCDNGELGITVSSHNTVSINEDRDRIQSESAISSHPNHYDFLEAWDTGSGQDVVIDGSGNVYKTNMADGVDIYDSNGNYITTWTGGGVFSDTNGLVFDSQWNLYVMDGVNDQVIKLDHQGNFVLAWGSEGEGDGQFLMANRIACDSYDNVYVADNGPSPDRIQKFDSNGTFIRSWNLPYGSVGYSLGLAIDSRDYVYVAGEYILKYDVDGNLIKVWGTPLTGDGRLSAPHGLAIDSSDALYVTELLTPRVQKFDSDGVFITEFGSDGGQGQLNWPLGITIADNGLVYVIDADNGRIQIYTPSFSHSDHYDFLETWDTGSGQDVKVGPDGFIYLSTGPKIKIYDINGNFITEWTGGGVFSDACGIIFDSQGNFYLVDDYPNKQIVKLDSEGNFVLAWGSEGEGDGQFKTANRIACDSQDNIYVADNGLSSGRIQKFDSNGSFIKSWNLPYGDGGGCIGLAIDSKDFIYVAGEYFLKFDSNGNLIKEWGTPLTGDGRLNGPYGLAVDNLDALYSTEIQWGLPNARVQKFDSEGVFITEFGSSGGQGQLTQPVGVTIASNGLVYVLDEREGEGHIQIYTPYKSHITEPTIISPNGGETLDGTVEIQWTPSNDSFSHAVTYNVYYSTDNGITWVQLASDLTVNNYQWDTTTEDKSSNYLVKIFANCSDGETRADISDGTFTIQNQVINSPGILELVMQLLFLITPVIAAGYLIFRYRSKFVKEDPFTRFIWLDKLDILQPLYNKIVVGLENIQSSILPLTETVPLLEPTTAVTLADYLPSDIKEDVRSGMKWRTILTLIEIAYQDPGETNPVKLAQSMDIPLSTLSRDIIKLRDLQYVEYFASTQVLRDGRYRNYIITPKGFKLLYTLKEALKLAIKRLKEKRDVCVSCGTRLLKRGDQFCVYCGKIQPSE